MLIGIDYVRRMPNFPVGAMSDASLLQEIEAADAIVKSYCGRTFEWGEQTEYFDADSMDYLLAEWPVSLGDPDADPVVPAPRVWFDPTGYNGAGEDAFNTNTEMTYGEEFVVLPRKPGILRILPQAVWFGLGGFHLGGFSHGSGPRYDYGPTGPTANPGALKTVYWGGWKENEIPADLKRAVASITAGQINSQSTGGSGTSTIRKERLGQYQVEYADSSHVSVGARQTLGSDLGGAAAILNKYRKIVVA